MNLDVKKKMELPNDMQSIIANYLCVESFCLFRRLFPKATRSVSVLGKHVQTVAEWLA